MTNEAALLAARRNKDKIDMQDLEDAKDKVLMGAERKSMIISDDEKKTTAYHEAGHTLIAKLLPNTDPIHKVTIIPRGRALGLTQQLPLDDKHTYTKEYLLNNICILMGGRIAEEIALNTQTTGASNDIERATEIARKMICEYGMNEKLGPLSFGKKEEEIFLGREISQHRDYSEETAQKIDQEVNNLIDVSYKKSHKLISNNLTILNNLAKALLEKETLNGHEIDKIVGTKKRKRHTTKSTERKKIDSQGKKS
jgi:cell division protease FtsH